VFVEDCYKLGYLHKTHGIKGGLVIRTDFEFSDNLIEEWESIFIEIDGILVPFFIDQIKGKSEQEIFIIFEDIDDESQAKIYTGRSVYIDKKDDPTQPQDDEFFDWLTYSLIDKEEGLVGEIIELLEYPGQNMLKVRTEEAQEIILPAIEDWIVSIDTETKEILVDLPIGLIDLNKTEDLLF